FDGTDGLAARIRDLWIANDTGKNGLVACIQDWCIRATERVGAVEVRARRVLNGYGPHTDSHFPSVRVLHNAEIVLKLVVVVDVLVNGIGGAAAIERIGN